MTDDNKQQRGLLFMDGFPSDDSNIGDGNLPELVEPAQEGNVAVQRPVKTCVSSSNSYGHYDF